MRTKLTITVDRDLVPRAKRYARERGLSLSRVIENALRELAPEEGEAFSARWRGEFVPADRDDERYRQLAKKYL